MNQNIAVIIPTYKETKNIPLLLDNIFGVLPKITVIFVDDSPQQYANELKLLIESRKEKIIVLSRLKKLGRGSAVIAGFKEALKNKKIKYIFEMDADLAHDPKEFTRFLQAIHAADLVIGSRYRTRSTIIKWPMRRLILSKIINRFLSTLLGLNLTDYTNGFRLYNRKAVEYITSVRVNSTGFIVLSEIAYKLKKAGFIIKEVPISFTDRKYGKSNADIKEHLSSLLEVFRIRFF